MIKNKKFYENARIRYASAICNSETHYKAMEFYRTLYDVTKIKWFDKKRRQHQVAAVTELSLCMNDALSNIIELEQYLKEKEGH